MDSVSGGGVAQPSASAPIGRRFAAAFIDLFIIPIALGILIGLMILNVPDVARSIILVSVNIAWLIFRDVVYSPGRAMVGLKLESLTGAKISVKQALLRNVLIMIPIILVFGYIVEIVALFVKKERIGDGFAKTRVVSA